MWFRFLWCYSCLVGNFGVHCYVRCFQYCHKRTDMFFSITCWRNKVKSWCCNSVSIWKRFWKYNTLNRFFFIKLKWLNLKIISVSIQWCILQKTYPIVNGVQIKLFTVLVLIFVLVEKYNVQWFSRIPKKLTPQKGPTFFLIK